MRTGIRLAALLAGGGLAISLTVGNAPATILPPKLLEAAEAFDAAQVKNDARTLNRLLADDYELLNGDGSEEDRKGFVGDYSAPGFRLDPFTVLHPIVRVWAGGAILGGIARLTGVAGGKRFDRCIRFTDVWALRSGQWKVAYTHVSRPPENACGTGPA